MSHVTEAPPDREQIELRIDYARELNAQQLAAVTAPAGPALVLAGAGAGKTRTLTYRVAWLIEQGIPPEHILLLTFTNKAAREMMRRVAELLGCGLEALWGGTFHSVGNRVLRRHAGLLGYRPDFTILDQADARDLVRTCLEELEIDVKATRFPKADLLGDIFSLAVNTGRSIPDVLERQFNHLLALAEPIVELAGSYAARKQAGNVMDFDDLLFLWLRLLQEQPAVRDRYQRRFQFILVDEYQDTNRLQSDLVDLLAEHHHNVMAVGDDSQSIYSWRGANFQNILRFPERHPDAQVFRIETNYRSTPEILTVANAAIAANIHQHRKQLTAVRRPGPKPVLVTCTDAARQAGLIARRVRDLQQQGIPLNRMAVLYRAHFHALELQMELTQQGIPFAITSGIRFFEQAHIKDVAAHLKLVCNPLDETAFKRLTLLMPGIGPRSALKLWQRFLPLARVLATEPAPTPEAPPPSAPPSKGKRRKAGAPTQPPSAGQPRLAAALESIREGVPGKAATAWDQFTTTIARIEVDPVRQHPDQMLQLVLDNGYDEHLENAYANYLHRRDDVVQLADFARQFSGPQDFLAQLALLTNVEAEAGQTGAAPEDRLWLSTVHQAKGLEFAVVFVLMLCDGLFPSNRSLESEESIEEERRLFYVAITRAQDHLYLCHPQNRFMGGACLPQEPSRFLRELPIPDLDHQQEQEAWRNSRSMHAPVVKR